MKIDGKKLFVDSSDKMGRHVGIVKSGCGAHKNKKAYTRKKKHANKEEY